MAHVSFDRVKELSTTTGTGSMTVLGGLTGFSTFASKLSVGDTFYYAIEHQTANEWEVGLGTYSALNTIARTTVLQSSSAGAKVGFAAGTKNVFITLSAARTLQLDSGGKLVIGGSASFTGSLVSKVHILGGNSADATLGQYSFATSGAFPTLELGASRNATIGSQGLLLNGDTLGSIRFSGSDGAAIVRSAQITAAVDGVAAAGDMPGRITFSTAPSGSAVPLERVRIDKDGHVGIGSTAIVSTMLRLGANVSGAATMHGIFNAGVIQSDVTASASLYNTSAATQAASFTLSSLVHYASSQGTFGTGSFVSSQYGFTANSTLIGASNNYGFWSNLASGVSRNITTIARASNVVTITTSVTHGYSVGQSVTIAAVTNTGLNGTFVITSVPTTTTFTYDQTGVDIASGADTGTTVVVGRWNFYAGGTAPNYYSGRVLQGSPNTFSVGTDLPNIQSASGSSGANGFGASHWAANSGSAYFDFAKSRSATIGTFGIVSSGDSLGKVKFFGDDGVGFIEAARIEALVDGTPGTNDMPGRLVFSTTADGAATLTERMRVDSSGNVGIATSAPSRKLDINDDGIRVRTSKTPATAAAAGNAGDICWDASYVYVCTAANTWKRAAIATW